MTFANDICVKDNQNNTIMKKTLLILSSLLLLVCACDNTEDNPTASGIVGEWSMIHGEVNDGSADVRMHLSLKDDGSYTLTMPAWDEQRSGTYTADDKTIVLTCNKIAYVLHWRNDGYRNAYDRYCDVGQDKMPDFSDFAKARPEEVVMNIKYTLKDGNLYLDGLFGMDPNAPFVRNDKFNAEAECRKHIIEDN